jgi:hypothetical protein
MLNTWQTISQCNSGRNRTKIDRRSDLGHSSALFTAKPQDSVLDKRPRSNLDASKPSKETEMARAKLAMSSLGLMTQPSSGAFLTKAQHILDHEPTGPMTHGRAKAEQIQDCELEEEQKYQLDQTSEQILPLFDRRRSASV